MFDSRRLYVWKNNIKHILNNIHINNEQIYRQDLINHESYVDVNHRISIIYQMFDKMSKSKYLKMYRKTYLFNIFPEICKLMKICGTSNVSDLIRFYGVKLSDNIYNICPYFYIYKHEIIKNSPEIDEELKIEFSKRRAFFWNSYPASTNTLIEQLFGAKLYIPYNKSEYIVVYGIFNENALLYCNNNKLISDKIMYLDIDTFQTKYLQMLPLRDYLVNDQKLFEIIIKNAKKDYERYKTKSLNDILRETVHLSITKKRKIILLLLCSDLTDDHLKAKVLYDNFKTPFMPLHCKKYLNNAEKIVQKKISSFEDSNETNYKEKIILLKVEDNVKQKAFEKLRDVNSGREISSKAQQYIDGLLKIPFGTFVEESIFRKFKEIKNSTNNTDSSHSELKQILINTDHMNLLKSFDIEKKSYIENAKRTLDNCVHGHKEAKIHIERLIGQWIHGEMNGTVFGFQGPPGTGKTTLAKNGFAKCLVDDEGNSRPIAFLPIGGSSGSSFLEGHGYTYMGSTWGRIVDILIEQRCMNPIIYIDELDKISMSERGQEINGILIHLTDPSQNKEFTDKYFSGIKFDLSKAIIIFSYNDSSKIDRILRDRITEIRMSPLSIQDKLVITNEYMIPEIMNEIGFNGNDICFDENIINYIIDTHTNEAGVRKLKEMLYTILREINIKYLKDEIQLPFQITESFIKDLFIEHPKNLFTKIDETSSVGKVNGLFASTQGIGGITIIEVHNTPSDDNLSLVLTGSQGDVMKESMKCSKTLAWNLLTSKEKENIEKCGLHIHCPMGATPKDGPSAGCAITLAIYSRLTKMKIRNDIAMTGEIDLDGNVRAIGGLEAKLFGALRAGVNHVLIPKENEDDYNLFMSKYKHYNVKITCVTSIHDILHHSLLGEEKEQVQ